MRNLGRKKCISPHVNVCVCVCVSSITNAHFLSARTKVERKCWRYFEIRVQMDRIVHLKDGWVVCTCVILHQGDTEPTQSKKRHRDRERHAHAHAHTHTRTRNTHAHTHAHTHTHTHAHAHTHTQEEGQHGAASQLIVLTGNRGQ